MTPTDGLYRYRGASIELSSVGARRWWATVRFQSQEKDFEATSSDAALEKAKNWVDDAPELRGSVVTLKDIKALGRLP